ncbi:vacuolar alkaline phosphatase [Coemansia furcata]|uniref:Vacuolar alkaline phosphatase n=1 Tax=Coemansia furcata TaxID=417177 RepID=A0ACC1LSR8_9FUNG|nr:vacuolar alkaline phosphatase [Coemansia furcata]
MLTQSIYALAIYSLICSRAALAALPAAPARHRNLIFMVSDGFGIAGETMARGYIQSTHNYPLEWASTLDDLLVGTSRTRSSDSLVTDSAAGATAFSCAQKTYNGAIGVSHDRKPCGTVLEAAKQAGYLTGIVSTARITHATPGSFAAHVVHRDMEELIAQHMISYNSSLTPAPTVDLMFGGGRCFFAPETPNPAAGNPTSSCRSDQLDLWQFAQKNYGYSTISTRSQFDEILAADKKLPLLGLFTNSHMSYEIDRDPAEEPSLTEMTQKALDMLHAASTVPRGNSTAGAPGFFIMIEGARIDMAAHDNDPASHLHDIIEYWNAVAAVRKFIDTHPDTLMIGTSDHETGGLTIGYDPEYVWYPNILTPVKSSAEVICKEIRPLSKDHTKLVSAVVNKVLPKQLGITNATHEEINDIVDGAGGSAKACKHAVGHVVSDRARLGWTTGGHTGVDVGLYAYGAGSGTIRGNKDNTHVGQLLADFLNVNPETITPLLAHQTTVQEGFDANTVDLNSGKPGSV